MSILPDELRESRQLINENRRLLSMAEKRHRQSLNCILTLRLRKARRLAREVRELSDQVERNCDRVDDLHDAMEAHR